MRFASARSAFVFRRLRPGVLLVEIAGDDGGELGALPLDELGQEIARFGRLHLFVDARAARGVAPHVAELWTAWFRAHRAELETVQVLAPSKIVHLNVSIAKLLSGTGELIRVHDDEARFVAAVRRAVPGFGLAPLA